MGKYDVSNDSISNPLNMERIDDHTYRRVLGDVSKYHNDHPISFSRIYPVFSSVFCHRVVHLLLLFSLIFRL